MQTLYEMVCAELNKVPGMNQGVLDSAINEALNKLLEAE